jgi:undecaprenyl-diphosphatase
LNLLILLNQDWRMPVLDIVLPWFSSRALLFVLLAGLIVWRSMLRGKGQVVYFMALVLVMGAADLSCNAIKHGVGRLRPEHSIGGTYFQSSDQWQRLPLDYQPDRDHDTSFPSAHAANTAALTLLAAMFWPKLRKGAWALPLLVGWSRVYLGKHYPTDVAAGWLLGLMICWLCWIVWRKAAPLLRLAVLPDESEAIFLLPPPACP